MPTLTPVKHDPFAPALTPVDFDPFAAPMPTGEALATRAESGLLQSLGGTQQMIGEQAERFLGPMTNTVQQFVNIANDLPPETPNEGLDTAREGVRDFAEQGAGIAEEARYQSEQAQKGVLAPASVGAAFGNPGNALRYYGGLMAESAPTMAAAMATRNPAMAAGVMGATTAGQTYGQERAQGATPEEAANQAVVAGGMEAALGQAPLETALGGGNILARGIKTAGQEAASESVTGAGQLVASDAMKGKDTSSADIGRTLVDSAILGGGMGAGEAVLGSGRPKTPIDVGAKAAEDAISQARERRAANIPAAAPVDAAARPPVDVDAALDAMLAPKPDDAVARRAATYERLATEARAAGSEDVATQHQRSADALRARVVADAPAPSQNAPTAAVVAAEGEGGGLGNFNPATVGTPVVGEQSVPPNGAQRNLLESPQIAALNPAPTPLRAQPSAAEPLPVPAVRAASDAGQRGDLGEGVGDGSLGSLGQSPRNIGIRGGGAPDGNVADGMARVVEQPATSAPLGSSQPARAPSESRATFDPEARSASVFSERLTAAAADLGIPAEQLAPLRERLYQPPERDRVTGLHRTEELRPTLEAAHAEPQASVYVEADLANLGGLNSKIGTSGADKYLRMMADTIRSELEPLGATVGVRRGGDEMAFVVQGIPKADVDAAMLRARDKFGSSVGEYATIPHTKAGKPAGVGLHFGTAEIRGDVPVADSVREADTLVEARKQGEGYEFRGQNAQAGAGQADARAAARGTAAPSAGSAEGAGATPAVSTEEGLTEEDQLSSLEREIGWDTRGGRVLRDRASWQNDETESPEGEVSGRTPWVGRAGPDGRESSFWRDRPQGVTETHARNAMAKSRDGRPLTTPEARFMDYAKSAARIRQREYIADRDAAREAESDELMASRAAALEAERLESGRAPRESRAPKNDAAPSPAVTRLSRTVRNLFAGWTNAPKVEVVEGESDVEGEYDPKTQTVRIYGNVAPERAAWVAFHEATGHHGIRGVLADIGKGEGSFRKSLAQARTNPTIDALAKAIGVDRKLGDDDSGVATEEALAELAAAEETGNWSHLNDRYGVNVPTSARPGVAGAISRFIDSVKRLFSSMGGPAFTDADWRKLVTDARRYVREGAGKESLTDEGPRFSKAPPTDSAAFAKWFGDSKVVDADGKPLVVYHGAPDARFMSADATFMSLKDRYGEQRGVGAFWFAKDRATAASYADDRRAFDYQAAEPAVIAAYLKLENPLVVNGGGKVWREAQAIGKTTDVIEKAQADGHDGIIIRSVRDNYNNSSRTAPTDTYVVFDSRQIKSATGNSGAFDPNNPSILKSTAPKNRALTEKPKTLAEKFERDWIDEYRDLTAAEKATGDNLPEDMQARRAENLRHGRYQDRLEIAMRDYFEPVAKLLGDAGLTRDGFSDYLWWRHAPERDAYLRQKDGTNAAPDGLAGISPTEAKANIAALPAAERAVYEAAAKKIDALRKHTLDRLVNSGQIAAETRDGLTSRWQHYVPLRGLPEGMDDPDMSQGGTGKGLNVSRNPLGKKALGRKSKPSDILEQMKQDLERALIGAEKQRVVKRISALILANPDLGRIDPVDSEKREVNGVIQYVPTKGDTRDQLVYLHNGMPVRLELADPSLKQALLNMNEPVWVGLQKLGKATRWLSAVKTSLSPYFMLINPVRDAQFAAMSVTAEKGPKVAIDAARYYSKTYAALSRDRKGANKDTQIDRYAREFGDAGGKTGYTMLNNIKDINQDLERLFAANSKDKSPKARARRAWIMAGDLVENANNLAENSTRLAVYAAVRDNGATIEEAAKYAKDVTVNFNVRGRLGKQMTMAYMFFNAAVQGSARLVRLLKNPIFSSTMGGLMATSYAVALAQMMAMGDDDDGESKYLKLLKDHDRQRAIPFAVGDEKFLSLPMAYGPNMFSYLGSKLAEVQYEMMQGREVKPGKVAGELFNNFTSSMSPIQVSKGLYGLLPEVIRVPVQLNANVDDFGNPINYAEKFQRDKDDPLFDDGNTTTGAVYGLFAQSVNALTGGDSYDAGVLNPAPEHARYITEQALGGPLRLATESYELAEKMILDIPLEAQDAPLSNVYLKSRPEDRQQSERYYENREEIERARAVWKKAVARQDEVKKAELLEEHPWLEGSELSGSSKAGREAQAGTILKSLRDAEKHIKALRDDRESAYLGTGDYEGLDKRGRVMRAREIDSTIAQWQKWLNAKKNGRDLPQPE